MKSAVMVPMQLYCACSLTTNITNEEGGETLAMLRFGAALSVVNRVSKS